MATTKRRRNFNPGDIVLVSSPAGDVIPKIHVKLTKKIEVKPTPSRIVGFKSTMSWPGYTGWESIAIYQDEIDDLRKSWSIPYNKIGEDIIFVYEYNIVKKVRINTGNSEQSQKKSKNYSKVRKNGKKINSHRRTRSS